MKSVSLILLVGAACSSSQPTPTPQHVTKTPPAKSQAPVPVCVDPDSGSCPFGSCGSNSPIINSFPINGIRANGDCNLEGVQLVPGSLAGGASAKCNGSTLDVRDDKLVGIVDGKVVCDGADLKGARFVLRGWMKEGGGPDRKSVTVEIAEVTPYKHPDATASHTAYKMTVDGKTLCSEDASKRTRELLGLKPPQTMPYPTDRELVIPITTELYSHLGHPLKPEAAGGLEWLNLACVDDALAKRTLFDLKTSDPAKSRAALLMLVANYCGNFPATVRGAKITWKPSDADPTPASSLEAKWDERGAVCVSKPRLVYRDGATLAAPTDLTAKYEKVCKGCSPTQWLDKLRACEATAWDSAPKRAELPHVDCATCTTSTCKPALFHSYATSGA